MDVPATQSTRVFGAIVQFVSGFQFDWPKICTELSWDTVSNRSFPGMRSMSSTGCWLFSRP